MQTYIVSYMPPQFIMDEACTYVKSRVLLEWAEWVGYITITGRRRQPKRVLQIIPEGLAVHIVFKQSYCSKVRCTRKLCNFEKENRGNPAYFSRHKGTEWVYSRVVMETYETNLFCLKIVVKRRIESA